MPTLPRLEDVHHEVAQLGTELATHAHRCSKCPLPTEGAAARAGVPERFLPRFPNKGPHCPRGLPLWRRWRAALDRYTALTRLKQRYLPKAWRQSPTVTHRVATTNDTED